MIKVLYVDDEEPLLELAKEFLESSGEIVLETTTSAFNGIKMIQKGDIDVVVSDYMMPEMDGLEFIRTLRRSGNDIPFILFTGKGREEVVIQALNEGVDSYLQKGGLPTPQFTELAHRIDQAAQRRRAAIALKQSESRLTRAEEIAGFGHWELHLDTKEMFASSGAKMIYGTEWKHESYELVKQIPLPEYRSQLDTAMADLIQKGIPYDIEFKIKRTSDGRTVEVYSRAEYDPVNRIVFGVLQDITERKKAEMEIREKNDELIASYSQISAAEEDLRAAKHKLAVAMDLAKLVYWDMDLEKDRFIFNDAFYSLYGTTAEAEGGYLMKVDDYTNNFVYPEDRPRVAKIIEINLFSPIGVNQLEHRMVRRDGQVRDLIVCVEVERDAQGRPFHLYGANQDVTDRKKAEVALERANRKLSLLNSITRHDITNQISVLRGNLDLVRMKVPDPEISAMLQKVDNSSRNILDQIRFTKEYQDMGSTAPQWQMVADAVRPNPLAKDIKISEEAARLSIYADPMLPKVFNNLIENTVRYSGKPTLISIRCESADGVMNLIYEDRGSGIPDEEKEKIFAKGFGKGTGLGLFLSREILAITGITIRENGTYGQGARFEICIPIQMFKK
ncbi:MAG TPA: response regulator [Methanomassiliicoccales archaeon]